MSMKDLQPHQQRVVDERADLEKKLAALDNFIVCSPVHQALPQAERDRLHLQCIAMNMYSMILAQRIKAFASD